MSANVEPNDLLKLDSDAPCPPQLVLMFAPQHWGELDRFQRFWRSTYDFDVTARKRLSGVAGHFYKAAALRSLAKRIAPTLEEDEKQLKETGYSPVPRAKELAAVIESAFCELYSALDCTRFVLCEIYPHHRGLSRKSTRKTFTNGHEGKIDERVPQGIRDAFQASGAWYGELLRLRDELTHADVGSCSRDSATSLYRYMHDGLGSLTQALVIDDVFAKLEEHSNNVNFFLGQVFRALNAMLSNVAITQFCCVSNGRLYQRSVGAQDAIDLNSGRCVSYQWFDQPGNPVCPLKEQCGAYAAASGDAPSCESGPSVAQSDGEA